MRPRDRLIAFFSGRYGVDNLYYALMAVFLIAWIARLFCRSLAAALILAAVEFAAAVWMLFRLFSRNIYARRKENEKFMSFFRGIKNFFVLTKNRIWDIKGYRYRKCPKCKAMLRLPRRKGKHTVVCPRCKDRFDVKIGW